MKMTKCDTCGKIITDKDNYDELGYSKIAHIEIMNSRKYQDCFDICNECMEKLIEFAKKLGGGEIEEA